MEYKTKFCVTIPCEDFFQRSWIFDRLRGHFGRGLGWYGGVSERPHDVVVFSDGDGAPETVAYAVAEMQSAFNLTDPFVIPFADTCSQRIPGEFGGGAFFAYRGVVFHADPQMMLEPFMEEVDSIKSESTYDVDMTFGGRAICAKCLDGTCEEA